MDLSAPQPDSVALPEAFYSYATGKPFEQCICCETALLREGTLYLVEKAFIQYLGSQLQDVAFEYAMCMPCVMKMRQALSRESLARLEAYFQERVDLAGRRQELLEAGNRNVQDWLQHCLVSHTPRQEAGEYQIVALCNGPDLLFGDTPYMLSGTIVAALNELLSAQTKEVLDGFVDEYFGLPPEWKELFKDRNLFFI